MTPSIAVWAALLLLQGWPAAAQQPDSAAHAGAPGDTAVVRLPPIEVVASILSGTGPTVGSGMPARTSILTDAAIRARRPRVLPELLATQPGVSVYDDLGSPYKPTLVTRGFTSSPVVGLPQGVSVFIDGVPVNEPDAGQVNFDLLPLSHLRRVEVLRGTAPLLGPNSLGGAINLVTRRGGEPGGEAELSVGSFGAYEARASAEGSAGGWGYSVGGGAGSEAGWRRLTSASLHNGILNLSRLGQRHGLLLQAFAARSDAQTAGSLPLSVYSVRPDSNLSAGDFEDLSQLHLAAAGYAPIGAGRASARAYLRRHDAERFNVNQIHDPDVRSFSRNRTLGASADWSVERPAGGGALALRAGTSGSLNRVAIRIFAERIDPRMTTHVESPIAEVAAFGTADYALGPATLSAGVRYDRIRLPFHNRIDPARDTVSTFARLTPRGGLALDLAGGARLYASAGQGFRAPAVIELACADPNDPCPLPFALGDDPPLDPVVATTLEAGAEWARGPVTLSGSAFRTEVRDDIFLFPYQEEGEPEGSTIDGYFANIERTRRQGIELDSRLRAGALSAYLSYAFTRATFEVEGVELFSIREEAGGENEIEPGDRLPLVPDHAARAGASLAPGRGVELGADTRYTGRRWLRGDEANEEAPLPGHLLVDLHASVGLRGWEVQAVVANALDTRYAAFGTFNLNHGAGRRLERFLTPGHPRSVRLTVRRDLGR